MTITTQWFGRRPPQGTNVLAAWGARAILSGRGDRQAIDLVPDRRQTWIPEGAAMPPEFQDFLVEKVAPWLDRNCDAEGGSIDPGGADVMTLAEGPFHVEASPQRSHGYLYIGAWMMAPAHSSETAPAPA